MNTNIVIKGDSSGDVKCTDEEDRNKNQVQYFKDKHELTLKIVEMAAEHREKEEKERERVRALEGYFQRPYSSINPELYKDLRIVETRRSKLPGRPAIKR